ncbi:MAG: hypothetical protein AAFX93_14890 [Verrucomicrobiota bacterium]
MNSEVIIAKVKQYPLAFICGGVLLVAVVLTFLRSDRLPSLETEYEQTLTESDLMNTNRENSVNLEENLAKMQEIVTGIDSRLIDSEAATDNYRYLLQMAEKSGVNLMDPSRGQVIGAKAAGMNEYPLVQFSVSVSGPYKNVLIFLYELRTGKYIVRIESLTMSPSNQTAIGSDEVRASIKFSGLGIPPEKEPEEKKKK